MHGQRGMLILDHERFKELLNEYAAVRGGDPVRAAACWRAFSDSLRRHAEAEERVLYPAYESNVRPASPAPLAELVAQHREMLAILDEIDAGALPNAAREARIDELSSRLWEHESREQMLFAPWMRACLSEAQRIELNERMIAVRDEELADGTDG